MSGTSVQLFSREISQATSSLTFSTRNSILETLDSILETRDSILETIEDRVSSLEDRGSRDCQLTFERYCILVIGTLFCCSNHSVKHLTLNGPNNDGIFSVLQTQFSKWKTA